MARPAKRGGCARAEDTDLKVPIIGVGGGARSGVIDCGRGFFLDCDRRTRLVWADGRGPLITR